MRAEISQVNERNGNWYLTLVEQDGGGTLLGKAGASIWRRTYTRILRKRGPSAADVLVAGQEIVVQVEVSFHEVYGLKLTVLDWDPAYTIGQLELQRQAILQQLQQEGYLKKQQANHLPPVLQRIAVLTSERAAGYADFRAQLENNNYGYTFAVTHFDIAVQGERTKSSVIAALDLARARTEEFDVVLLLRGGGSKIDLSGFDHYEIGVALAEFPLPVLTGIGHETDETLPDLVAHTPLKTPTALAEFIINRNVQYEARNNQLLQQLQREVQRQTARARQQNQYLQSTLQNLTESVLHTHKLRLHSQTLHIRQAVALGLHKLQHQLELQEQRVQQLQPHKALERGFVLVYQHGKLIRSKNEFQSGTPTTLHFHDGTVVTTTDTDE